MNEERIIGLISKLKAVSPDADFAAKSKKIILSSPRSASSLALNPRTVAARILDIGLSLALMTGLVIVVLSGVGLIFKGSDNGSQQQALNLSLTNEANAAIKDINVHLKDVQYFNAEATKTNAVLKAAAGATSTATSTGSASSPQTTPGQGVSTATSTTSSTVPSPLNNQNSNIDNLLNQAAQ